MRRTYILIICSFISLRAFAQISTSYQAMPIPQWEPAKDIKGSGNHFIQHDPSNGNDHVFATDNSFIETPFEYAPFNPGIPTIDEAFPGIKNFTDLSLISDPTPYPWCTNVKLFMTFPNAAQFVGSGTMINSRYVITAGHCVYSHDNGGWADEVIVVPAYYSGNYPYGSANATNMYSWTGWTVSHDYDWDMGYIELNTDIGNTVGWLGFGYNNDDNFYYDNTFHNPGYPSESPYDGSQMYYWYGDYDNVQTHRLYYTKYCYGGQSGSGSYYKDGNDDRYVYAVLSHQLGNETGHIRITSDKFNSIYNQIYGIGEISISETNVLSVYPNPSQGTLRLNAIGKQGSIIVRDLVGEVVFSLVYADKDEIIDLSELSNGVYSIEYLSDGVKQRGSFILMR